jgi:hypothetical protein
MTSDTFTFPAALRHASAASWVSEPEANRRSQRGKCNCRFEWTPQWQNNSNSRESGGL